MDDGMTGGRLFRGALGVVILLVGIALPSHAAPWWWAQFNNASQRGYLPDPGLDNIQDLQAYWVSTATNADTVIMSGYDWYSSPGGGHMVLGVDFDSTINDNGLTAEGKAAGRIAPVRLVGDSEGANWVEILGDVKNCSVAVRAYDSSRFGEVHHKVIWVANQGVMTGSGNFTWAQVYNSGCQPNNYLWVMASGAPDAVDAYGDYFTSFSEGIAMRPTRGNYLYHPTGLPNSDTIEIYFSNDDNESITTHAEFNPAFTPGFGASGYDLEDILCDKTIKARESIFYALNKVTLTLSPNGHAGPNGSFVDDLVASSKLVAGCEEASNDFGYSAYTMLSDAHTCRNADNWPNGTGTANMHNKFMIFDLEIVATGSPNHTGASMRSPGTSTSMNPENMIVIHDFRLGRRYIAHWHHLMKFSPVNGGAGGDQFDTFRTNPPGAPTNLTVTPAAADFNLTWTAPGSNMARFSRYYVFVSPNAINTNRDIGDEFDDDGDSMVDEDPVGDVDGFSTGSVNDDDADGTDDEDPWLFPEAQVKGGGTSATISTVNCGDALAVGTDYWFAVVAVDSMGFESLVDTSGPHQLGLDTTKLFVEISPQTADTNGRRSETTIVAASVFVRGDTAFADTLAVFSVRNLGTASTADVTVNLWRDANRDGRVTAGDSLVATLAWNAASGLFRSAIANDSRAALGTTGETFLIALAIQDTADVSETFQVRIDAATCSSARKDSGPVLAVTNTGVVTIVSDNQVTVAKRGDTPSASVAKGETVIAMTLRIGVTTPGDTLTDFAVTNLGTMTSADVAGITLYEDAGADSLLTAADTLIAVIPFAAGATWRNSAISYPFPGTTFNALVAIGVSSGATGSRTFQGQIDIREVRMTNADSGPLAAVAATSVFTIPSDFGAETQIVLNEIQPNPGAGSDIDGDGNMGVCEQDEEYVEVFNRGTSNVNLAGWTCVTSSAGDNIVITSADSVILRPGWFGVFKSETGTQIASACFRIYNETGILVETYVYSTNNWTTYAGVFNTTNDTAFLKNASGTILDSYGYGATANGDFPFYRYLDGLNAYKGPGSASPSYGRPNGRFTVSATPTLIAQGVAFTLNMTALDNEGSTCTSFASTVTFSSNKGSVSPTTSDAFVAGLLADSITVSGLSTTDSVTIKVSYNTADTGVTTITITVTPADTKTVVTLNSHVGDSAIPRGTDTVVLLRLHLRGDTTGGGDTLSYFSAVNLGNADSQDLRLTLWRDDGDSEWDAPDSFVAQLSLAGGVWSASGLQASAAAYLGADGAAGRDFLLLAEFFDTAGLTETLQFQVPALGVKAVNYDSGPTIALTNSGIITIVSANAVTVAARGDTPNETMGKGETRVVMTLLMGATNPNDTITAFAVTNVSSMQNADIAALRLYHDAGADSLLSAADTLIATIPFASGSTWRHTGISYAYAGASIPVLVTIQTAVGATSGTGFQGRIAAYEVGMTNADSGPATAVTYTATYSIASDTSPDTAIVINEILATGVTTGIDHDGDGTTTVGDEHFVELYNNSDGSVDIGNWDLGDQTAGDIAFPFGLVLGPRQFLIAYRGLDPNNVNWYRYNAAGTIQLESGTWSGGWVTMAAPDTVILRDSDNVVIDARGYAATTATKTWQRIHDGADTWLEASLSPGKNLDPSPLYNRPSPNARILLTALPTSISEGDSLTLTLTVVDGDTNTITTFIQTVALTTSDGTITPATTGAFAAGVHAESITITSIVASGTKTVTAAWQTTTTGTTAIAVYKLATVTCTINLEARGDNSGCSSVLYDGVETYYALSNAAGAVTFTSVRNGTYTFTGKDTNHLRRTMTGITVAGVDTSVSIGTLYAGDANDDNRINIFDAAITKFFSIFGIGALGDIDGDGDVDAADLSWIRLNFGRKGE